MSATTQTPPVMQPAPPAGHTEPVLEAYPYRIQGPPISMDGGLYAFGETLGVFGAVAPHLGPDGTPATWESTTDPWTVWRPEGGNNYQQFASCDLALERVVPGLTRGGWIALELPGATYTPFWVEHAFERSFAGFMLSARVSALRLRRLGDRSELPDPPSVRGTGTSPEGLDGFTLRETTVHAASEALTLAQVPDPTPVRSAPYLELETREADLAVGQRIWLSGHDATTGAPASELAWIASVEDNATLSPSRTRLTLRERLAHDYERASLVINANVVEATHGEHVTDEVLGSGDASLAAQSFTLRRGPLSLRSTPGDAGASSPSLRVRVEGIEWRREQAQATARPDDATFATRVGLDGRASILFGDGAHGRRLPTGVENVVATYRVGAGRVGNVPSGSLNVFRTQPRGVRAVVNPEPAIEGADGDAGDDLRVAVPRGTLLLDRVVSLRDHEAFARESPGVAKVRARAFWDGQRRVVHLSLADGSGNPLSAATRSALRARFAAARDGLSELALADCERRNVRVGARIRVTPGASWDAVRDEVARAVRAALSIERRDIAQPLRASEIIALIQRVPGVVSVQLSALYLTRGASGDPTDDAYATETGVHEAIGAPDARQAIVGGALVNRPARLLLLDPDPAGLALELATEHS